MWCARSVCLATLLVSCHAEFYTSIADLQELVGIETFLIESLENQIADQESRLTKLKRHLNFYKHEHSDSTADLETYLMNPINAFLFVKRLTYDWRKVELESTGEFVAKIAASRADMKYPIYEDMKGAALALVKLQDMYQLDVSTVSQGVINGMQYSRPLSSSDCYVLAMETFRADNIHHSVKWFKEALQVHDAEDFKTTTRWEIMDNYVMALNTNEDFDTALMLTEELLQLEPENERLRKNRDHFLERNAKKNKNRFAGHGPYEKLCRGEMSFEASVSSRLSCRYVNHGIPFLRIAPFKLEEAFLSPPIHLYHDVLYDAEITTIQQLARPRFKRALVFSGNGTFVATKERTSKSAWLRADEHRVVVNVNRRTALIASGLSVETAELFQVVNYGIGGHYSPHYDFTPADQVSDKNIGNRIATLLFYMSDVAQGGATVFPELGVSVVPKKGSAAFWYNLLDDGEGDTRTLHAACPVLIGSKWVGNKWFHEGGQEFIRPCLKKSTT